MDGVSVQDERFAVVHTVDLRACARPTPCEQAVLLQLIVHLLLFGLLLPDEAAATECCQTPVAHLQLHSELFRLLVHECLHDGLRLEAAAALDALHHSFR